jgi:predicted secreted protein
MLINMFSHFAREFAVSEALTDEPKEREKVMFRRQFAALKAERLEAVAALRALCARHGDNDWSDNLNLSDVIEKHLGRHL